MVDSTCCRAHQSSAGARKISGPQAIGITRGGLNTKILAVWDALGNPLRFVLTTGQRHDSKPVPELLDGLQAKALLADKACDSDKIVQAAEKCGMQIIIPCRVNCVLDTHRYEARHLVENLFQRMKVFRRVATRYDKQGVTFLGFVHIDGTMKSAPVTFRTRLNGQSLLSYSFMKKKTAKSPGSKPSKAKSLIWNENF